MGGGFLEMLILKHANKNRLGAVEWGPNDFDVCEGDRCIGRIFLSVQAPQGHPWFWTITAMDYAPTMHSRGYQRHASKQWRISRRSGSRPNGATCCITPRHL